MSQCSQTMLGSSGSTDRECEGARRAKEKIIQRRKSLSLPMRGRSLRLTSADAKGQTEADQREGKVCASSRTAAHPVHAQGEGRMLRLRALSPRAAGTGCCMRCSWHGRLQSARVEKKEDKCVKRGGCKGEAGSVCLSEGEARSARWRLIASSLSTRRARSVRR